jgi:hypothetical protein
MSKSSIRLLILSICLCFASPASAEINVTSFDLATTNADGSPSTQAGAHPYQLTTSFALSTHVDGHGNTLPDESARNLTTDLPAGFSGNPAAYPTCTEPELENNGGCSPDTQVGYVVLTAGGEFGIQFPIYNMKPPPGVPAQFGFYAIVSAVHLQASVRTGGDYGLRVSTIELPQTFAWTGSTVIFWGVPADPSHDELRGSCLPLLTGFGGSGLFCPSHAPAKPFLTNPSSCTPTTVATGQVNSWHDASYDTVTSTSEAGITGCDKLPFGPSLMAAPDVRGAGSPTGLSVNLHVPQNASPIGVATANLRTAAVTLPQGMTVSASSADGLEGCSPTQIAIHSAEAATCPDGSRIGGVSVDTPLLNTPLTGGVYLATPHENPSGGLLALYIVAEGSGVTLKLAGSLVADPLTGQLTATFDNNPQLPFTDLNLDFKGGPRAPLSTPKACGTYTTHAELTSWASSTPVSADSSFTIDQNCAQAGLFTPTMSAGTLDPQAGGSSPFTLTVERPSGQQDLGAIEVTLPPGVLAHIGDVPLCPESQAAAGTCASASQVGTTTVGAGPGGNPVYIPQAGRTPTAVYLAGPYKGAPFSLSIVVPAQAGPFDLGTVVVRAALFVDRHDAHVSVLSDAIPTILDGIPLNVQKINVTVNRPGFMVAPTDCDPMQITGIATSSAGQTASLASRFQVASCASLRFAPKLTVSTAGRASKGNGASLTAKLTYPHAVQGAVNLTRVKVELPRQLPSRLSTLQQACTAAQFDKDPSGCPAASVVGHATVHTPLLPVALTGPAYFVSHGGEAFPSLIMVLQGDNVTIDLVGTTFISKSGITSTTFKTVPDVPFSTFELTLPEGRHSALAANLKAKSKGSFCGTKLVMPTELIAQNGAAIHQSTRISTAGCPARKAKKARKAGRHG